MASIKDLKKRITSTKNTQQTTKAMKMVSAAKLRRATDAIVSHRPYAKEIARLMSALSGPDAGHEGGESAHTEAPSSASKKPVSLAVVISSDRGLCGGYNGNVIKAATVFLAEKQAQGRDVKFVFIGKKAYEILRGRTKIDLAHYEEFGQKINFKKASDVSKKAAPLYDGGEVDEVYLIYNLFINAITQEMRTEKVLPLEPKAIEHASTGETYTTDKTLFIPNRAELLKALSGKYFVIQLYRAFLEAQASEHGSRMSAMENATKNAGDMIRKLTLVYNKQRQAGITKELLEIIAGSESQKTQ